MNEIEELDLDQDTPYPEIDMNKKIKLVQKVHVNSQSDSISNGENDR